MEVKKPRAERITKPCEICGKEITRIGAQARSLIWFCSRAHSRIWTSARMTQMNLDLNPDRMRLETQLKIGAAHKALKGHNGKTYEKTLGKHTHRMVAEYVLGRRLEPGEIVHHINGNCRDNRPENIHVFPNQAEHARHHFTKPKKS